MKTKDKLAHEYSVCTNLLSMPHMKCNRKKEKDLLTDIQNAYKEGWDMCKKNLWKKAQGDELPEYEREVIVLVQVIPDDDTHLKVAFGHRPDPKGWEGKSLATGKEEHFNAQTYGSGGWNQPNVAWWLDTDIP